MRREQRDAEFSDFVAARWASLYRAAYLMVPNHAGAEDLVQTALLATYKNWGRIRDPHALESYTRATIVNTALGWFRKKSWREQPTNDLPDRAASDEYVDPDLLRQITRLPGRQRAVVMLRFYADLTVAETARELGVTEGTVKSHTHRALGALRGTLRADLVDAVEREEA